MAIAFVVAMALLLALAARAAADPPAEADGDDVDDEQVEALAQPDVVDDPTTDDSMAQLESLGVAGIAGVEDWLEEQARHQRPSPWGRVDLQIALLHRDDAPGISVAHTFDELWIELVWRR